MSGADRLNPHDSGLRSYNKEVWGCDLKPTTKLVLVYLWRHATLEGTGAYPSQTLIAEATGLSVRTVRDAQKEILEDRWATRKRRGQRGWEYTLTGPNHTGRILQHTGRKQPFTPAESAQEEGKMKEEDEGKSESEIREEAVRANWNALAGAHGLIGVRGKLNPTRLKHYRARLKEEPEFWRILGLALGKRGQWYVDQCQPTFDQAVRQSYFDEKIRDLGWQGRAEEARAKVSSEGDAYTRAMKAKGQAVIEKAKARERRRRG